MFLTVVLYVLLVGQSYGKPVESQKNSNALDLFVSDLAKAETNRQQRSPQYGLLNGPDDDYSDYSDDYDEPRHFGHKYKHHKPFHHKPLGVHGGHGCHGFGCGGSVDYGEHYDGHHETGNGGSFATASAGSINGGGSPHGGHSQANAESASFSFGPYTATFSVAHASSGDKRF